MLNAFEHLNLGQNAENKADYVTAITHYSIMLNTSFEEKEDLIFRLINSYYNLGSQLDEGSRILKNSDGVIQASDFSMNVSEVSRIANFIYKENVEEFTEKVLYLANSELLDPSFVGKQIGKKIECPFEASFHLYTHFHHRIQPNVYFSPLFYTAVNELDTNVDPIYHYLTNSKKGYKFHRLFDFEWLSSQDAGIQASDCPISYYWKNCYSKRITPCDPKKVFLDNRVKHFFFYEVDMPFLSSFSTIESVKSRLSTTSGIDTESLNQIKAIADFFSGNEALPHHIPVDFNPDDYLDLHKDMMFKYQQSPFDSIAHYLLHGISEERPYNLQERFSYRLRKKKEFDIGRLDTLKDKKPLCVLMHLYYVDLWLELKSYIDNIDVEFDLHINLVDSTWTSDVISLIRQDYPEAVIKISPNEGRDIGGYFNLLKTINIDDYLAFITMHSKKSQHISERMLVTWRTNLLEAILGSKEVVKNNLAAFVDDPSVGIIGSALHREDAVGQNSDAYEQLLDLYNISENNRDCEYVSGTMMMLRADILKRIYYQAKKLSFTNADNKGLDFLVDGQLEHALERVFGNVMKELGYKFYWS